MFDDPKSWTLERVARFRAAFAAAEAQFHASWATEGLSFKFDGETWGLQIAAEWMDLLDAEFPRPAPATTAQED